MIRCGQYLFVSMLLSVSTGVFSLEEKAATKTGFLVWFLWCCLFLHWPGRTLHVFDEPVVSATASPKGGSFADKLNAVLKQKAGA